MPETALLVVNVSAGDSGGWRSSPHSDCTLGVSMKSYRPEANLKVAGVSNRIQMMGMLVNDPGLRKV